MKNTIIQRAAIILFVVASCAACAQNGSTGSSFGDQCAAEGKGPGSDTHRSCVAGKIAAYCASAGGADTPEFKACVKDENSRAFTRDMIGRQGY